MSRRSSSSSVFARRSRRSAGGDGSASSVPRVKRSERTASTCACSRSVSSAARSVSSCSHGELSTTTCRQPFASDCGRVRRATSGPTSTVHILRIRYSGRRSAICGTAAARTSAIFRGAPLLMTIGMIHLEVLAKLTRFGPTFIVALSMAKPRRGDTLELAIEDLAFGGEGVGRADGYVIFVRGGLPGDLLRVRLVEARGRFGRAMIDEVLVASPDRVEPPCPYFGRCGGCRLQHLAYPAQLAFKEKQVRDCLQRLGGLGAFELRPILPAPEPYGYRNKMEFTVAHDPPAIGLHAAERYDVVPDIERCLLQSESTNTLQAQRLVALVESACARDGSETLLDLYAGTGAISLLLARRVRAVYGVELAAAAVADAIRNASANGIDNCTFLAGEVRHVLPDLVHQGVSASIVVADPPRAGFHPKALLALAAMAPARIVYVSCNPSTLARDVADLARHGYRLEWVQPVDMFPQTPHIEAVARLRRPA